MALVSVESLLNQVPLRVQVIEHRIRVELMRGCKHAHLVVLGCCLQTVVHVGSDIYSRIYDFAVRKSYLQDYIRSFRFDVIYAMYQSFVQVKNQQLLLIFMLWLFQ